MLENSPKNDSLVTRENIFKLSLFAFVFFIPVSQSASIKLLIFSLVLSLTIIRNPRWKYELVRTGRDLLFYFLILALGLFYTQDLNTGFGVLEKNLSMVVVPILFSRIAIFDKDLMNRIFSVFTGGVVIASCICLGYAVWRDYSTGFSDGYYYDQFTSAIDSNPTYMAYYLCFSIIFLLYYFSYERTATHWKMIIVFLIVFLSIMLMFTAGRSTFVSILMMVSFFFLKLLFDQSSWRNKIPGLAITTILMVVILFQSPYSKKIVPNFPDNRLASMNQIRGDSWERLVLWSSAMEASSNVFLGVGTGDYTDVMRDYYTSHNLIRYAESNFNAHNQYIQILFSNGLPGLFALVIILMRPIRLSVGKQNIFGMLTFFPFLIYGISEVFLGRYQGIIFFVLLHQMFVRYLYQKREILTIKTN